MVTRHYERSYVTARNVLSFLEIVGWITVAIGVLAALVGFGTGGLFLTISHDPPFLARLIAAVPGLIIFLSGLFAICYVQVSRSHVDMAEMTRELLDLARTSPKEAQARTSMRPKPVSEDQRTEPAARADPPVSTKRDAPKKGEERLVETYKGVDIYKRHNGHYVGEKWFANIASAKEFVDHEKGGDATLERS